VAAAVKNVGILHKGFCSKSQEPELIDYEPLGRKMWRCPECLRMITYMDPEVLRTFGS
jgi:hypothetical protein